MLTATSGRWSGLVGSVSYSYQWERCGEGGEGCSTITGATASTYTLTESDVASTLRVLVTATDERGSTTAPSSATAVASRATLVNVAAPSISGPDGIEEALTADRGIWTGEGALTYAYTWELCNENGEGCGAITGATEPSYTPSSSDLDKTLKVVVTAEGTAGKESVASAVTPVIETGFLAPTDLFPPTSEGNLTPGETLTAQTGTWVSSEPISYTYQWRKCNEEGGSCANITGATSSTYKLERQRDLRSQRNRGSRRLTEKYQQAGHQRHSEARRTVDRQQRQLVWVAATSVLLSLGALQHCR